jgi:hypothetical protein
VNTKALVIGDIEALSFQEIDNVLAGFKDFVDVTALRHSVYIIK